MAYPGIGLPLFRNYTRELASHDSVIVLLRRKFTHWSHIDSHSPAVPVPLAVAVPSRDALLPVPPLLLAPPVSVPLSVAIAVAPAVPPLLPGPVPPSLTLVPLAAHGCVRCHCPALMPRSVLGPQPEMRSGAELAEPRHRVSCGAAGGLLGCRPLRGWLRLAGLRACRTLRGVPDALLQRLQELGFLLREDVEMPDLRCHEPQP